MISMTGFDLPLRSMRQQISSAIDVILQLNRFEDGTRRLVSLHEVTGMEGAVRGHFVATGIRPNFMDTLRRHGVEVPAEIFAPYVRS